MPDDLPEQPLLDDNSDQLPRSTPPPGGTTGEVDSLPPPVEECPSNQQAVMGTSIMA